MQLIRSLLVVAVVTPLAVSSPAGSRFFRRTGDDDGGNDGSSSISISSSATLSASSSITIPLKDLPTSTTSLPDIPNQDGTTSISTPDKDITTSTSLSAKDDKSSSSSSSGYQSYSSPVGFSYGTGVSAPSGTTQEIVTTEVVYTILTTCPVTSTVASGTTAFEEVTTAVSTVTRTSTSTICTKCVAPPKGKPSLPSTSAGATTTSSLPSVIIFSLTQPATGLPPSKASTSSETGKIGTGFAPVIVYSLTLPKASSTASSAPERSSKPEVTIGTGATFSQTNLYNSLSLTISVVSTPSIPGYGIVPAPSSIQEGPGPFSNATSTVIPVFSAGLLGNAYGGGFVKTASLYVTKLPFPNGPTEGVPPGYGSISKDELSATVSIQLLPTSSGPSTNSSSVTLRFPAETITQTYSQLLISTSTGSPPLSTTTAKNATNNFGSSVVGSATTIASGAANITSESQAIAVFSSIQATATVNTSNTPSPAIIASSGKSVAFVVPFVAPSAVPASLSLTSTAAFINTEDVSTHNSSPAAIAGAPSTSLLGTEVVEESSAAPVTAPAKTETTTTANINAPITLPTEGSLVPLASQTLIEIGAVGSPVFPSGENQAAPITLAAQSSNKQIPTSATILSPVIGANGVTSLVGVPAQSAAPLLTPVVGSNGVTSLISAPIQPAATILTPIVGANGVTSLISAPAQSATPVLTPSVGSNGVTSLVPAPAQSALPMFTPVGEANGIESSAQPTATAATPVVGANGAASLALSSTLFEQASAPVLTAATVLTPVVGANGVTSLAVIPTPIVGANGLTSLAIFSTPVAAANGLAPPAVILTPVVGANGLTSLAVLATPVVGANGLTSLAIGLGGEQAPAQPNGTPSPIEASVLVPGQQGFITPPVMFPSGATGTIVPSSPLSNSGSGSSANSSVHVPLNPTQIPVFQGSAFKYSLGLGAGLVSLLVFLFLL